MTELAHTLTLLLCQIATFTVLFFGVGLFAAFLITAKRILTGRYSVGLDLLVTVRCSIAALAFAILLIIVLLGPAVVAFTAIPCLVAQGVLCLVFLSTLLWPAPELSGPNNSAEEKTPITL